eukprot:CAMPEP_0197507790 /NCGR_PEP_ID=MMETSP1312-20131121/19800_1 /TAXON_ID=464262 /ORGANISM="Genus nov. species nov., Strain RCC2335" /LENGTH=70 /DNA_ID=CAMNT_0043055431 /DNA_START=36 /DNA_END=245 /DNA_ORIENTATION=-
MSEGALVPDEKSAQCSAARLDPPGEPGPPVAKGPALGVEGVEEGRRQGAGDKGLGLVQPRRALRQALRPG